MIEYSHPSVSATIVDNSFFSPLPANTGTYLFACGRAKKGRDNTVVTLNNTAEALREFGEPDLDKLKDLTLYTVYRWLNGGGRVHFIRILPQDATHSNLFLSVAVASVNNDRIIYPVLEAKPSMGGVGTIQLEVESSPVVDSNGATRYTLGCFHTTSRGENVDGLGVRIRLLNNMDNTYAFRTYALEVTGKDNTGNDSIIEGPFTVSFEPSAKDRNGESVYYANVINKYSRFLKVTATSRNIDEIRSQVNSNEEVNPLHIDFLFGAERDTVDPSVADIHNQVKFGTPLTLPNGYVGNRVTVSVASNLSSVNRLSGGSEGTWSQETQTLLLNKAYNGEIDNSVTDEKMLDIDIILDSNYPATVKRTISSFCEQVRGDCVCALDCGFQANVDGTINYRASELGMSSYRTLIQGQDYVIDDVYTGSEIKVTSTYFMADKIATLDNTQGMQYTYCGPRRGVITGFKSINFVPNEMDKERLYRRQINYVERDQTRTNFASQLSSQVFESALSNWNNVRSLMRIQRIVKRFAEDYKFEFNDSATLGNMNSNLNEILKAFTANRTCSSITASIYSSGYDALNKTVRIRVDLVFTGLIERIRIETSVNK